MDIAPRIISTMMMTVIRSLLRSKYRPRRYYSTRCAIAQIDPRIDKIPLDIGVTFAIF